MSGIEMKKLLQSKDDGEQWYAIHAPEEVLVWGITNPWPKTYLEDLGVRPQSVRVKERLDTEKEETKFNLKTRKTLDMGLDIVKGSIKSGNYIDYNFTLTVDDTYEFNRAMTELSLEYQVKMWEVACLRLWCKGDALVTFQLHNPDGNGTGMYLYKAKKDGETKLYPEIAVGTQILMVAKFKGGMAKCVCNEALRKTHGCMEVAMATRAAMKQKMDGKWGKLK